MKLYVAPDCRNSYTASLVISLLVFSEVYLQNFFFWRGGGGCGVLMKKPEGKKHLEDLDVDGRIILKWILKTWDEAWTGLIWFSRGRGRRHL
jgi:hypothetical protein